MQSKNTITAKIGMIIACIGFGSIGLFVKAISLPSSEIALYRAVIAFIMLFFVLLFTGKLKKKALAPLRKSMLRIFISGVAMGFNWILLFEAYNYTSVALSTLCYYFAPVIVTIACVAIFKEKTTIRQWCCSAASVIGLALIIGVSSINGGNDMTGVLLALGSAVLYATVVLLNKGLGSIDGITRCFLQFAAAAIVLIPYCAFTGGFHFLQLKGTALWCMILVGVVHSGILYCFYFHALSVLRGQESAVLSYIDPLFAVIFSALFLQEKTTVMQLIGGGIILLSTLCNELPEKLFKKQNTI